MKIRLLSLGLIAGLILSACHKDNVTNNVVQRDGGADGFGASTKPVTGRAFSYPSGVSQTTVISAMGGCFSTSNFFDCPADGDLEFYFTLSNTNTTATTVVFPPGTVVPSPDTLLQGAVIVQGDTFVMPPQSLYCVRLNAHCINHHRVFRTRTYDPLIVSDNANLKSLIDLLGTKKIVTDDANQMLQQAVWNVADSGRLLQSDINAINSLP